MNRSDRILIGIISIGLLILTSINCYRINKLEQQTIHSNPKQEKIKIYENYSKQCISISGTTDIKVVYFLLNNDYCIEKEK